MMIVLKIAAAVAGVWVMGAVLAVAVIVRHVSECAAAEDAAERHLAVVPGAPPTR